MPNIDPRPFGGNAYSGGVYGSPTNPTEWQHQPGDHSDTGILPLLTPVSGTGGATFGFSTSGTGTETFTGTGGVTFGFETAGTGTAATADPPTFCDYDFAGDTYDNAADTYDCSAIVPTTTSPTSARPVRRNPIFIPRPTPITGTGGVAFGFSIAATGTVRNDEGWLLGLFLTEDDLALVR